MSEAETYQLVVRLDARQKDLLDHLCVVQDRPKLKRHLAALQRIRSLAESCARQLTGWSGSMDKLPFEGRQHLPQKLRATREDPAAPMWPSPAQLTTSRPSPARPSGCRRREPVAPAARRGPDPSPQVARAQRKTWSPDR